MGATFSLVFWEFELPTIQTIPFFTSVLLSLFYAFSVFHILEFFFRDGFFFDRWFEWLFGELYNLLVSAKMGSAPKKPQPPYGGNSTYH